MLDVYKLRVGDKVKQLNDLGLDLVNLDPAYPTEEDELYDTYTIDSFDSSPQLGLLAYVKMDDYEICETISETNQCDWAFVENGTCDLGEKFISGKFCWVVAAEMIKAVHTEFSLAVNAMDQAKHAAADRIDRKLAKIYLVLHERFKSAKHNELLQDVREEIISKGEKWYLE